MDMSNMANIFNFGQIGSAIGEGRDAYEVSMRGPVSPSGNGQGSLGPLISSDLATASYMQAMTSPLQFMWGQNKWGSKNAKVAK